MTFTHITFTVQASVKQAHACWNKRSGFAVVGDK